MKTLSQQLYEAVVSVSGPVGPYLDDADDGAPANGPLDDAGLIVRVIRMDSSVYPGRDAHGVLPIIVTGHESMSESEWSDWVRAVGLAHYGAGYVERILVNGIDLKEMAPTAPFGRVVRQMTEAAWKSAARNWTYLDAATSIVKTVEQWPSLYNAIVNNVSEQAMTLRELVGTIISLPNPMNRPDSERVHATLGDIIDSPNGQPSMVPDY